MGVDLVNDCEFGFLSRGRDEEKGEKSVQEGSRSLRMNKGCV